MKYTYAGESFSKKIARVFNLIHLLHKNNHYVSQVATTLSRDLGDIPVLLALGVPQNEIHGFDLDEQSIERCNKEYPEIKTYKQNIWDAHRFIEGCFVANVDLCSSITPTMAEKFANMRKCTNVLAISITVLKGRDAKVIKASRELDRVQCTGHPADAKTFDRAEYLSSHLPYRTAWGRKITPFPSMILEYQSDRSPMIILNYADHHTVRSEYWDNYGENMYNLDDLPVTWGNMRSLAIYVGKFKKEDIAYLISNYPGLAKWFSLPKSKAAALKAHYRRGSYSVSLSKQTLDKLAQSIAWAVVSWEDLLDNQLISSNGFIHRDKDPTFLL